VKDSDLEVMLRKGGGTFKNKFAQQSIQMPWLCRTSSDCALLGVQFQLPDKHSQSFLMGLPKEIHKAQILYNIIIDDNHIRL